MGGGALKIEAKENRDKIRGGRGTRVSLTSSMAFL